jgi:hypothetical protein
VYSSLNYTLENTLTSNTRNIATVAYNSGFDLSAGYFSGAIKCCRVETSKIFKCWYWRIAKWLIGGKVAYSKAAQANI